MKVRLFLRSHKLRRPLEKSTAGNHFAYLDPISEPNFSLDVDTTSKVNDTIGCPSVIDKYSNKCRVAEDHTPLAAVAMSNNTNVNRKRMLQNYSLTREEKVELYICYCIAKKESCQL